jgi:predicted helicase
VWFWSDYPNRGNERNVGIDLVAELKDGGGMVAILCQFLDKNAVIQKSHIDSFLAASAKNKYVQRIIFTSASHWSKSAADKIDAQIPKVKRIDLSDLERSKIDWSQFDLEKMTVKLHAKKKLRVHQAEAVDAVCDGFSAVDRGKLIMACGTGKTFTSLKIAERYVGKGGVVAFFVPSLSLMSQVLREWISESEIELCCYSVCSDTMVGKRNDSDPTTPDDLEIPATTDGKTLAENLNVNMNYRNDKLTVIFATYQSIDAINIAQKNGAAEFDLVICDEAHRTTGAKFDNQNESQFVRIHDNNFIRTKKRLYMTATPRLYSALTKSRAKENEITIWSMDDETIYGKELFYLGFAQAVEQGLLSDYKVVILGVSDSLVEDLFRQKNIANGREIIESSRELILADLAKIIGCRYVLGGGVDEVMSGKTSPLRRVIAFTTSIKQSKNFCGQFQTIQPNLFFDGKSTLTCEVRHVDGTQNVLIRNRALDWLRQPVSGNECRILSNARCLSEGVDIPALDAVIFLTPRKSQVDIVQSVGRVMRKSNGKNYGYIILPIVIKSNIDPMKALDDNKTYKIVWDVLQALRAHDDRFQNIINVMELDEKQSEKIIIDFIDKIPNNTTTNQPNKLTNELTNESTNESTNGLSNGLTNKLANRHVNRQVNSLTNKQRNNIEAELNERNNTDWSQLSFEDVRQWKFGILSKIVQKCGEKQYWESWAKDVAKIARMHIEQLQYLVDTDPYRSEFLTFLNYLQTNINNNIDENEAIEMLAQHKITKPIFDALFGSSIFSQTNPISMALESVVGLLDNVDGSCGERKFRIGKFETYQRDQRKQRHKNITPKKHENNESNSAIGAETAMLSKFYESVRKRVRSVETAVGKQKIILELYDKFFKTAFPKMVERLGIVYTPVEVVDFIIQSVEVVLRENFSCGLSDEAVHVLDPFTGTGTFIVRLLQSGLIRQDDLQRKYQGEIFANEIVLLAYYIAAVNIENAYQEIMYKKEMNINDKIKCDSTTLQQYNDSLVEKYLKPTAKSDLRSDLRYEPFDGIVLTDTFQSNELNNNFKEKAKQKTRKSKHQIVDKPLKFQRETSSVNQNANEKRRNNISTTSPITVIIGNPPYSAGQKKINDNNRNLKYPRLDKRIAETYAEASTATSKRTLYDSYIRAIRWASDIVAQKGVIGVVTNGSFIDSNSADGVRKCFAEEFTDIYVLNCHGNQRTSGEISRREGGKIFGVGCRAPIAITILIKNPERKNQKQDCKIHYYDIGDYLERKEKLKKIHELQNIKNINWQIITPNKKYDWINQRTDDFDSYLCGDRFNIRIANLRSAQRDRVRGCNEIGGCRLENCNQNEPVIFRVSSLGLSTNRDAWCYNFSKKNLSANMNRMIDFYNEQVDSYKKYYQKHGDIEAAIETFLNNEHSKIHFEKGNLSKISWTHNVKRDLLSSVIHQFQENNCTVSMYRPFNKINSYFHRSFNERVYQLPRIFPIGDFVNEAICVCGTGVVKEFSTVIVNILPDIQILANARCFPFYVYEQTGKTNKYLRNENITDAALAMFKEHYNDKTITKRDIFYYVYGVLNCREYQKRFAPELKKQLPQIPFTNDFRTFTNAGRQLANLHLNYETLPMYPLKETIFDKTIHTKDESKYRIREMQFTDKTDKNRIFYNSNLSLENIPREAFDYVVNGKSALEWIIERYRITIHKETGIINDPNDWCIECGDPKYIINLIKRIVQLSIESMNIINNLPKLYCQ